jgi:hypothetical protein
MLAIHYRLIDVFGDQEQSLVSEGKERHSIE